MLSATFCKSVKESGRYGDEYSGSRYIFRLTDSPTHRPSGAATRPDAAVWAGVSWCVGGYSH